MDGREQESGWVGGGTTSREWTDKDGGGVYIAGGGGGKCEVQGQSVTGVCDWGMCERDEMDDRVRDGGTEVDGGEGEGSEKGTGGVGGGRSMAGR